MPLFNRHTAAAIVSAALVLMLTLLNWGPQASGAPGQHDGMPGGNPNRTITSHEEGSQQMLMIMPDGKGPTWNDISSIYTLFARAKQVNARFKDVRVAERAGFKRDTRAGAHRNGYIRYNRPANAVQLGGELDVSKPVSLFYRLEKHLTLAGLAYRFPASYTAAQLDTILPPSLVTWHEHINMCRPTKRLPASQAASIHDRAACESQGGHFVARMGWEAHVWLWQKNKPLFEPHPDPSMDNPPARQAQEMTEGAMEMVMLPPSQKPPTWADIVKVYRELAPVRQSMEKYRDVEAAIKDGYVSAPALVVEGQGAHYLKGASLSNLVGGTFDVAHPPVLVYDKLGAGAHLLGLMYLMPDSATEQQLNAAFPASLAGWHKHINNCFTYEKILPIHDGATCLKQGAYFLKSTGWGAHTWLWEPSAGLFDMELPTH
jgi:hypothetical protein